MTVLYCVSFLCSAFCLDQCKYVESTRVYYIAHFFNTVIKLGTHHRLDLEYKDFW
jgi:hypothetical protein